MASVQGRVYLDPNAFQGGCARVRVRYFNGSGRLMQSHYSEPLCGGPIFNKNGTFDTFLQSNSIRRVQICTQYAWTATGTWGTTACANRNRGD